MFYCQLVLCPLVDFRGATAPSSLPLPTPPAIGLKLEDLHCIVDLPREDYIGDWMLNRVKRYVL